MDAGAHFHRCDLQVHSPRDRDWAGLQFVTEDERNEYAASLVRACREKGLDAIAITDHHDMVFARIVREAAEHEKDDEGQLVPPEKQIVVFPGIELTLNVPCQALLIFDADFPADLFSLALIALAITPSEQGAAKTAVVKRLESITTLVALRTELDKHEYLKNRYIILPNVSDSAFSLLRKGNAPKYGSMPCVAGYVDGSFAKLGKGNRNIVEGGATEWGNKRIAVFQTSDSRRADHSKLGEFSTWIKWAAPTAEALRQAALAQESRVSHVEPEVPQVGIRSLSVSNSAFLGPIEVEFNPQYNALIGGRGSGKSTILEYLRWALCDQLPALADDDDLPNYQLRRRTLIEKTLRAVSATVQVSFTVNGMTYVVRRSSTTDEILLKVGDGEFEQRTEAEVRMLLPIQAYSQKQLSNVSVRIEELTRFVEAPIRTELDDIESIFLQTASEMRQVYATLERLRGLERQQANDALQIESLVEQAENIRSSLTGLSEDDARALSEKPNYELANEAVDLWLGDIGVVANATAELEERIADLPSKPEIATTELPNPDALRKIEVEVANFVKRVGTIIKKLRSEVSTTLSPGGTLRGELLKPVTEWRALEKQFSAKYEKAKEAATAHASQLQQLANLEKRTAELRVLLVKTKREANKLGKPDTRFSQLRDEWVGLQRKRTALVQSECGRLTLRSHGEIRASIEVGRGIQSVLDKIRSSTGGSGLRREKIEAIGEALRLAPDPIERWLAVLDELKQLADFDADNADGAAIPACSVLSSCGLARTDLAKIASRLDRDSWIELVLTRLEDRPVFEFRVREGEYIPFANASAGQQATALLKTLLNQPGPPLIIDQPEEDLDNPVILEVVSQIWEAKKKRQVLFASHNANLVVNGDAELVAWCDYRVAGDSSRGRIRDTGAIDIPGICDAIKKVMEGGEAAFKLRRDKYGF